ncbi:MAG TPA: DUF2157 domain-containing protein, partial [Saprospiraceae bacterium]|nr:DUF2157 domain-containing protein [Saprospiraceae bacterium]
MSERELQKLVDAGIIDANTSQRISDFLVQENRNSGGVMLTIFASIGALLLGGGIILILAHNWDRMPEFARVLVALTPIILGQLSVGYTLFYKSDSSSWREASGVVLFLAIGATLATLGQIYQLPSDTTSFLKVWIITGLPIMYIIRSNTTAFLILIWIFIFAVNQPSEPFRFWHWMLLVAVLPYVYLQLQKTNARVNFVFHWIIAVMVCVFFVITFDKIEQQAFLLIAVLSCAYYQLGHYLENKKLLPSYNSWKTLSHLGAIVLCYIFTFDGFW